jgi:hypothetical protein
MKKNRRSLPSSEVPPTVLKSGRRAADQTKINSSDPPLTAVCATDPAQPLLALFQTSYGQRMTVTISATTACSRDRPSILS